ncbi:hypothetical protein [Azospirillum argentinense]
MALVIWDIAPLRVVRFPVGGLDRPPSFVAAQHDEGAAEGQDP